MKHGKHYACHSDYEKGYKTMLEASREFMNAYDDFDYDWRDWFDEKPSAAFNDGMSQAVIFRSLKSEVAS